MNALSQPIGPYISQRPRPLPSGQYGSRRLRYPAPAPQITSIISPPSLPHGINDIALTASTTHKTPRTISDVLPTKTNSPPPVKLIKSSLLTRLPRATTDQPTRDVQTNVYTKQVNDKRVGKSLMKRLLHKLQIPLFILLAVIGGQLMSTLAFGEIAIGAYAVFALIRHVASSTTFLLALIILSAITLLEAVGNNGVLVANFAIYAFLLLVIGTISLGAETHG